MEALLRAMFLLPICLSAQFTAFLTKFRSSEDSLMMRGRNSRKVLSDTFLSWTASSAISTKPALFTYSFRLFVHSLAFPIANRGWYVSFRLLHSHPTRQFY